MRRFSLLGFIFVSLSIFGLTTVSQAGPLRDKIQDRRQQIKDIRKSPSTGPTVFSEPGYIESFELLSLQLRTLQSRLDTLKQNTNFVRGERASKMRDLFTEIGPGKIKNLIQLFKDGTSPREALELSKVLRDRGFKKFKDDPGAQEQTRDDLKGLFGTVDRIRDEISELRCYDNPDRRAVRSNAGDEDGVIVKFIDKFPPVVLYGMKRILDEFTNEQWPNMLGDVGVPKELLPNPSEGLESLCNDSAPASGSAVFLASANDCPINHEQRVCKRLRRPAVHVEIRLQSERTTFYKLLFETMSEFMDDKKTIGAVVAGGVTISPKMPAKPALKTVANLFGLLERRLDNQLSRRDGCLAADAEMERDLLQCTALAEYDVDLCPVQDLAVRRANDLSENTFGLEGATTFVELAQEYQMLRGVGPTCQDP